MAEILLELDSDELAVLSTEGLWGSFRSALEDVETIASARVYLPEEHAMQLCLQGVLHGVLVKLENRQAGISPVLCVDRIRLLTLFNSFKGPHAGEGAGQTSHEAPTNPEISLLKKPQDAGTPKPTEAYSKPALT
ncbi:MAG: hypothetical protein Q9184_005700 [Pyrenodesmia sp. 2 TL-2023]